MKKNFKLPILLLAVVVMMSIFYIKDANDSKVSTPVNNNDLNVSTLNHYFTEARMQSINEVNALIDEYELQIASGDLSAEAVASTNVLINSIVERKKMK